MPLSVPAKRFRFERHIKTLSQRIITTYPLLIAIEHALPNWPLVDFRKESSELLYGQSLQWVSSLAKRASNEVERVIALKEVTNLRLTLRLWKKSPSRFLGEVKKKSDLIECSTINDLMPGKGLVASRKPPLNRRSATWSINQGEDIIGCNYLKTLDIY